MVPLTRRTVIVGVAASPALAKTFFDSIADPIAAAIVAHRAAVEEYLAACDAYEELLNEHERLASSGTRSATDVTWHGFTAAEVRLQTAAELRLQFAAEAMMAAEKKLECCRAAHPDFPAVASAFENHLNARPAASLSSATSWTSVSFVHIRSVSGWPGGMMGTFFPRRRGPEPHENCMRPPTRMEPSRVFDVPTSVQRLGPQCRPSHLRFEMKPSIPR